MCICVLLLKVRGWTTLARLRPQEIIDWQFAQLSPLSKWNKITVSKSKTVKRIDIVQIWLTYVHRLRFLFLHITYLIKWPLTYTYVCSQSIAHSILTTYYMPQSEFIESIKWIEKWIGSRSLLNFKFKYCVPFFTGVSHHDLTDALV